MPSGSTRALLQYAGPVYSAPLLPLAVATSWPKPSPSACLHSQSALATPSRSIAAT
jgi:hypothetical protein